MSLKWFSLVPLLIVASACSHESPPSGSPDPAAQLPIGFVDLPRAGEVLRGKVPVTGWVLSEAGVQSVAIYVDRTFMGMATVGLDRPDIPRAFPGFPAAEKSGWTFELDTSTINEGEHEVIVQARSREGASRDIGSVAVTLVR